jgi:WD40 repeat protein
LRILIRALLSAFRRDFGYFHSENLRPRSMNSHFVFVSRLLGFAGLLGLSSVTSIRGAVAPSPENLSAALRNVQETLEQQTKRIDRLYTLLGPHLEELEAQAQRLGTQQREDKALALDLIREVADVTLTSVGCVNPIAAEFAVLTKQGGVRIFDAAGQPVKELAPSGKKITCLAFSPAGTALLLGTNEGELLIWDVGQGTCATVSADVGERVKRVAWLGNDRVVWGTTVTYWSDAGTPVNHDKSAGAVLSRATGDQLWTVRSFVRDDFYSIGGSVDGQQLAVTEIPGQPRGAFLLDASTGGVLHTCYDEEHGCGPLSVGLSPDGNTLAVGYAPYDIILWNARTGQKQKLLEGHTNWVVSFAFAADSRTFISGAGDATARIWRVETGAEVGRIRFRNQSAYVNSVGLSPSGDVAFALTPGVLIVAKVKSSGNG